ncbi:recombinase family protein [Prochlorococcus sp. AH-736-A13]|jgi:DNA invertase Pin-like site-specific DNA recombinase|nr:recombinase family protein [Prochlorococcus sp. AH-736-A13]|tara:strand:+ start:431 stop:1027 length:597 start_codon:yes stop_codon:yes gene_type:complete
MNKVIGYARVSSGTGSQTVDAQVEKLKESGCDLIFSETVSTRKTEKERPELMKCLSSLRKGDTLKISTLSRLGRTQREVINRLNDLQAEGINLVTLDGLVNTEALGKFAPILIGLLTGLNEVERDLIQERVNASVEHRRNTGGDLGGRPKTSDKKEKLVIRLREDGDSYREIREQTGLGLATIRRIIADNEKVEVGIK